MKKIKKVCSIPFPQGDGAPLIFEPVPAPFINSGWRKLLSVLEIIFSCLIVLFMAYWQLFVTAMSNFDTLYEHPIGAQAYLGLGMVVLIPILFLLALWKKAFLTSSTASWVSAFSPWYRSCRCCSLPPFSPMSRSNEATPWKAV